ncbi:MULTISPECIES: hypothetical protein [unclassified Lentimonas]|uniref:hypothetical protein n=1 Tax=unclassified Lentimonas TaxID=2630993 RepID=UPI001329B710|nr:MULTISPECIES: hypothetical protein [unclassified Lentimonas]CAA6691665.1 Unannotated [Lentimonas sp. CC19]CAA6692265.1 Unannotated [Lentimonas sp. CC10]CAA7070206.1 Unannotated [Lentimonas sp. CC11]
MKQIEYDIDEVLALEDFTSEIRNRLPDTWDEEDELMYEEERVLRGLAEFYEMSGNGFSTLIENENFELLHCTLWAAERIPETLLLRGLRELEGILTHFEFPKLASRRVEHYFELGKGTHEGLAKKLEELDKKYFYSDDDNLWDNLDYLDEAKSFALQHVKKLRSRSSRGDQLRSCLTS